MLPGAPQTRGSTSSVRKRRLVVAISLALAAVAAITCGGTTGRDGLPQDDDSGADAAETAIDGALDAGMFDVAITYADRVLPDVVAPADTGADGGGYPWPTCAPFVPVDQNGNPVPLGTEADQVPGVYVDGGGDEAGELRAPDGSACATYGWLGSTAVDDCMTSQTAGFAHDFPLLPPCNWCSGVATTGPGADLPLRDLCLNLYACAVQTGCGAVPGPYCLCGSANGPQCFQDAGGPCLVEELSVLQATNTPTSIQNALDNYTSLQPQADNNPGYCGSALNFVLHNTQQLGCFDLLDAAASP
jgi:hypothetical protein